MNNLLSANILDNTTLIATAVALLLVLLFGASLFTWKKPKRLNIEKFQERWKEVQKLCKDSVTWPLAIIDADKLLDEALKQRRYKGKTMGERLVSAQRALSDNDGVWFGHKLRNKIVHEEIKRLYRRDVESALRGFRQALKDLGALR